MFKLKPFPSVDLSQCQGLVLTRFSLVWGAVIGLFPFVQTSIILIVFVHNAPLDQTFLQYPGQVLQSSIGQKRRLTKEIVFNSRWL